MTRHLRLVPRRGLADAAGMASGVSSSSTDPDSGWTTTYYNNGNMVITDSDGNLISDSYPNGMSGPVVTSTPAASTVAATSSLPSVASIQSIINTVTTTEAQQNLINQQKANAALLLQYNQQLVANGQAPVSVLPAGLGSISPLLLLAVAAFFLLGKK